MRELEYHSGNIHVRMIETIPEFHLFDAEVGVDYDGCMVWFPASEKVSGLSHKDKNCKWAEAFECYNETINNLIKQ